MTAQPLPTVEERCGNCKFWLSDDEDANIGLGDCRRFPPSWHRVPGLERIDICEAARTMHDEWCGEHRPLIPADSKPLTLAHAVATVLASTAGHTGGYRIVAEGNRMVCEPAVVSLLHPHEPPAASKRIDETETRNE